VAREHSLARLGQCGQQYFRSRACTGKSLGEPFAQARKSALLRQQDQTLSYAEDGEGRTRTQPKILAELFGYGQLPFFANLGRRHVFNSG
jgi:hypothetical protein